MKRRTKRTNSPHVHQQTGQTGTHRYSIRLIRNIVMLMVILSFAVTAYERNSLWQDRVTLLEDALGKSMSKDRLHNNLGLYYFEQGRIEDAMQEFMIVLSRNPDDLNARNNLGMLYNQMGLIHEAMNEYKLVLQLTPDSPDAHNNLAIVYRKLGRLQDAVNEYRTAIMLAPGYAEAHNNLGNIYFLQGLREAAYREYSTALQINPDFHEARENLQELLKNQSPRGIVDTMHVR